MTISTVFLHERKIVVSSPRTAQVLHTHYFLKSHRFQPIINLSQKNVFLTVFLDWFALHLKFSTYFWLLLAVSLTLSQFVHTM